MCTLLNEFFIVSVCTAGVCVCVSDCAYELNLRKNQSVLFLGGGTECGLLLPHRGSRVWIQLPGVRGSCVFSALFFQDGCYPSFLRSHKEKSQHLFIGKYSSCEGTFSLPPSCLTECLKCKMCQACVSLCTLMGLVRDY